MQMLVACISFRDGLINPVSTHNQKNTSGRPPLLQCLANPINWWYGAGALGSVRLAAVKPM